MLWEVDVGVTKNTCVNDNEKILGVGQLWKSKKR